MRKSVIDELAKLCTDGDKCSSVWEVKQWNNRVKAFLDAANEHERATELLRLQDDNEFFEHALRLGYIQGLVARSRDEADVGQSPSEERREGVVTFESGQSASRKVFVVHGRDIAAKEASARFLEKLGLHPVILHEQPSSGRTVIEKFELYSGDIDFAVVLLTPDDGAALPRRAYCRGPGRTSF